MMKRTVLLALVLGSTTVLGAQVEPRANADITRMTGGVTLSTNENVKVTADEADYNQKTGEIVFRGTVLLRQDRRPASQTVPATNLAGEPFPAPKPVVMRMRGGVQISVGDLTVSADEADVDGLTGEMTLRGNVKMTRLKK
jgi:lipopolysaccharide assembly outer membrane protein LptD (OstA)